MKNTNGVSRLFFYPDYKRYVILDAGVLSSIYAHSQRLPRDNEAGGELFAVDPGARGLLVDTVSGPDPKDKRSRFYFNPDVAAAHQERQAQFAHGRHAAGLWHTHPEARPRPSRLDRETTWKYLDALGGMQERYLMLILGNANDPPELVLCSAERRDTDMWIELVESSETSLGR